MWHNRRCRAGCLDAFAGTADVSRSQQMSSRKTLQSGVWRAQDWKGSLKFLALVPVHARSSNTIAEKL